MTGQRLDIGQLRDALAVIGSSVVMLERTVDRGEARAERHLVRIREHLASCYELLERLDARA